MITETVEMLTISILDKQSYLNLHSAKVINYIYWISSVYHPLDLAKIN